MKKTPNPNICLLMLIFLLAMAGTTTGQTIYVDADAPLLGDGTNWATAHKYLQDALADADSNPDVNQIWVAQGTYTPESSSADPDGSGDRTATFQLINGVALYGGFPIGGGDWESRDPNTYETILSGDLAGDDGPDFANIWENSYHVTTGSETDETAVLDGFTITAGNANGPYPHNGGGGMFNGRGSSPALANCTFSENRAFVGGGIYNYWNSPTLTNCTFSSNTARYSGGGMYNHWYSSPTLTNCIFSGNSADYYWGGGMWNCGARPRVTNCTFSRNSAEGGGGIYNYESRPILTNCTFSSNSAGYWGGGGMFNDWDSSPTLTNCTFSSNSAERYGGGMYNYGCIFRRPTLTNCIVWGNTAPGGSQIYNKYTPQVAVTYSDIQGGWSGAGNIKVDPCFVQQSYWDDNGTDENPDDDFWVEGDYHLLPTSPCIDAGDNTAVPADTADLDGDGDTDERVPFDLDGNPRFVDFPPPGGTGVADPPDYNEIVDMGAYEAVVPPMEVPMKFTPQALNPDSKGRWVKAHFVLPDGFAVEDVDVDTPAILQPLGIESDYINAFINKDRLVEIEIGFDRAAFCGTTDYRPADITVIGLLTTGQYFYGTDTIRIITDNLKHLAVFASYWLDEDCGAPDWCSGFDLDQNSVVNFLDFAIFDKCCVEIITQ